MAHGTDTAGERCLLVQAGEYLCAIPLHQVRRVVRSLRVSPFPGAGEELLGLAEFAGEPVPVFDLARLVGAPAGPHPDFPVTVIAGGEGGELVGLNTDAALRFVDVDRATGASSVEGVVQGEVIVDGVPARLLDLTRLGTVS
jgi:purine-binding chemotaxis protein CheW